MAERPASRTAVLVCQGRAAADGRYAVGRFSDSVAYALLDPEERTVVDLVRSGSAPTDGRERAAWEMVHRTGVVVVPRTVAIDDAVREHAAPQVVVLGAGLDARAWRMPELTGTAVFEVDHPASQADKRRRVGDLTPTAARVVPVAVDLAEQPLGPSLEAAGFDPAGPTTWVWEGVVPYLARSAVASTVTQVGALSGPGSTFVVQYQARSLVASTLRRAVRVVLRVTGQPDPLAGEPWRTMLTPDDVRRLLEPAGFDVTSDRSLLELADGLDLPPDARGSLGNGRVAVGVRQV